MAGTPGIGSVARASERFDFLLHGFQQPGPDALPEQLPEQIRCFFFFALQEGLSEFPVVHGGWLDLVLMPSCWCMRPTSHQPGVTPRGTLPTTTDGAVNRDYLTFLVGVNRYAWLELAVPTGWNSGFEYRLT